MSRVVQLNIDSPLLMDYTLQYVEYKDGETIVSFRSELDVIELNLSTNLHTVYSHVTAMMFTSVKDLDVIYGNIIRHLKVGYFTLTRGMNL